MNSKGTGVIKDEPNQECMAKILRVLETLTDSRRLQWHMDALKLKEKGLATPPMPKAFPLSLSLESIETLLYHTYKESVIRNSLAVLIQRGYVSRTQETTNSIPDLTLNVEVLQKALNEQSISTLSGTPNAPVRRARKPRTPSGSTNKPPVLGSNNKALGFENRPSSQNNATSGSNNKPNNNIYKNNNNIVREREGNVDSENGTLSVADTSSLSSLSEEKEPSTPDSTQGIEEANSYSQSGLQEKEEPAKPTIEHMCQWVQDACRKVTGWKHYLVCIPQEGSQDYKDIQTLIQAQATPERLQYAYEKRWNYRNDLNEYWYRDPLRLTLHSLTKSYGSLIADCPDEADTIQINETARILGISPNVLKYMSPTMIEIRLREKSIQERWANEAARKQVQAQSVQ